MSVITTQQSVDIAQLSKDLLAQIISVNASYLTISVSIILGSVLLLSILMYFFNFKPMKEGLDKQTESIESLKKETELKIEELKQSHGEVSDSIRNLKIENEHILENLKAVSAQEVLNVKELFEEKQQAFDERLKSEIELRVQEVDAKISVIEEKAIEKITSLDLQTTWDMHYMWETKGVYVNSFTSIIRTLEKTIEAMRIKPVYDFYFDLGLKELPNTIEMVTSNNPRTYTSLPNDIDKLEFCLSLIQGHEVEKAEVSAKIAALRQAIKLV